MAARMAEPSKGVQSSPEFVSFQSLSLRAICEVAHSSITC